MVEEFTGTLICEQVGAWTYVTVPDEVAHRLGGTSRIPVTGEVNGAAFAGSVMTGPGGSRYIVVNGAVRDAAGVTAGDTVRVRVSADASARTVDVPDDLTDAMAASRAAGEFFEGLSYSRKKEYVTWIVGAKRQETRQRRITQAVEMLAAGRHLK